MTAVRQCFAVVLAALISIAVWPMPEALEKWPLDLFGDLLPRHLEIVYEINRRFLDEVRARFPGDDDRLARMSIIEEGSPRQIRMAHLASVGSFAINGVAELHSRLLRERTLHDFAELWPKRFQNKTNGATPRRFMRLANPRLSELITSKIGDGWLSNLDLLSELEAHVEDPEFRADWRDVKQANKQELCALLQRSTGVIADPNVHPQRRTLWLLLVGPLDASVLRRDLEGATGRLELTPILIPRLKKTMPSIAPSSAKHIGSPSPIGATLTDNGANFCLFSRTASGVELLLYYQVDDTKPARVLSLDPVANHTYHYWHVFVPGVRPGQIYGYRVQGADEPANGLRFDSEKMLLDPYGRGVVVPSGDRRDAAHRPGDNAASAMKSVVVDSEAYDVRHGRRSPAHTAGDTPKCA